MDKLTQLLARCKYGVYLTVNEYRDYYETVERRLDEFYANLERAPDIEPEVRTKMIELDMIVDLQFYPDTPSGSYQVLHYDLDAALDIALKCLREE